MNAAEYRETLEVRYRAPLVLCQTMARDILEGRRIGTDRFRAIHAAIERALGDDGLPATERVRRDERLRRRGIAVADE